MKYMHVRGRQVCHLSPLLRHCVVLGQKSRNEWGGYVYRAPPQELFKPFESMSLSPSDWPACWATWRNRLEGGMPAVELFMLRIDSGEPEANLELGLDVRGRFELGDEIWIAWSRMEMISSLLSSAEKEPSTLVAWMARSFSMLAERNFCPKGRIQFVSKNISFWWVAKWEKGRRVGGGRRKGETSSFALALCSEGQ